ncbi:MAG TPA: molybdopterin-dependent oxidoreductase [Anaerolineales bacterium]
MSENLSRRDFLKLASAGAATTAVLTGCGPASRYVRREPYTKMPEYTYNGQSTQYATTCFECAAACGIVVRTIQGRAHKVEGNPNHPVNLGKTCARGQASLQGLYNPDRITDPVKQPQRGSGQLAKIEWDEGIKAVADALKNNQPGEIAFLLGMGPDHLFDLVSDLVQGLGAPAPMRYGAEAMFDGRATLAQAAQDLFGQKAMPFFDIGGADVVFSFGAPFLGPWLSQVAFNRAYAQMRKGAKTQHRGYLVQFEPRMSQTASKADEWIPIKPGTEGMVALAIGRIAAEKRGGTVPQVFAGVDVDAVAKASTVAAEKLKELGEMFAGAQAPLALPGGAALAVDNGLDTAKSVLALNAFVGNLGKTGGVWLTPFGPMQTAYAGPASPQEMAGFIEQLRSGAIKVLFIHGVNPVFELPKSLGFVEALKSVPTVISFATFPDETASYADYILPDHHGLESWGYQRVAVGVGQPTLSGAQPVVNPFVNSRATVDVLLAAAAAAGGKAAETLKFKDEVEFIQSKLGALISESDTFFSAAEINSFAASFQQYGGWWKTAEAFSTPSSADVLSRNLAGAEAQFQGEGEFFLQTFLSPTLGVGGANKPWLQELADPTTTVMWDTWIEMNPHTAEEMGIENGDEVLITSAAGAIAARVYKYPAIRPDTVAIPFGQGHVSYGQYAQGRGANPADLFPASFNEAGDMAYGGLKVKVEKTGKKRELPRLEGVLGVYGFDAK